MPTATPIEARDADLAEVAYNGEGLVPAIVQEHGTGQVLMLGWMDVVALRRTLSSGRTWFWSRSRQEYWNKGATSGNLQHVTEVRYDWSLHELSAFSAASEACGRSTSSTSASGALSPCRKPNLRMRR